MIDADRSYMCNCNRQKLSFQLYIQVEDNYLHQPISLDSVFKNLHCWKKSTEEFTVNGVINFFIFEKKKTSILGEFN